MRVAVVLYCTWRPGKQGLGTAYVAGFHYVLERDFDCVFEMDADFSHNPRYLPALLAATDDADLVYTCRYIGPAADVSIMR